ncbi:MAG TPA: hypothetical protein VN706_10825 [Gemmatimonadaceae bacterium]|nr:hypothetical protein [Gemmatimonadaceae bacterium]
MHGNPTVTALVRRLYLESVTELFAAYGFSAQADDDGAVRSGIHRASYISVLSLTAPGLRLACTIDLDAELLARLHPARSHADQAPPLASDLEDWSRELNNQLGGRLKNKLLARGFDLMLGLPSLLAGVDISAIPQADMDVMRAAYVARGRRIIVTLASQLAPDITLADMLPSDADDILREGEIALF